MVNISDRATSLLHDLQVTCSVAIVIRCDHNMPECVTYMFIMIAPQL